MIHFKHTQELFDKFRNNYFKPNMCEWIFVALKRLRYSS